MNIVNEQPMSCWCGRFIYNVQGLAGKCRWCGAWICSEHSSLRCQACKAMFCSQHLQYDKRQDMTVCPGDTKTGFLAKVGGLAVLATLAGVGISASRRD